MTGIIRVIYAYAPGSRIPSYSGADLWSAIHVGMAIVCACLPTLRPVFVFLGSFASAYSSLRRRIYSLREQKSSSGDVSQPLSSKDHEYSGGVAFEMTPVSNVRDQSAEEASLGGNSTAATVKRPPYWSTDSSGGISNG